jgi:hypothetical protein
MPLRWPDELPRPLQRGYADGPADRRLVWKPDVGPAIMRQRANYSYGFIQCIFMLTASQATLLEAFWEVITEGGTLPFAWEHPRTRETITACFDPESQPLQFTRVETSAAGPLYEASVKLRVIETTIAIDAPP